MNDKEIHQKPEIRKPTLAEEPSLFEEKAQGRGRWKMKLFLAALALISAFIFWPKGEIQGEAVVQAKRFSRMTLTGSGILKELLYQKGDSVKGGESLARFENPELLRKFHERKFALQILSHKKMLLLKELEFLRKQKETNVILYENGAVGRVQFQKTNLDYWKASKEILIRAKEIESEAGEVRFLKEELDRLELKAPFDGMLLSDPGIAVGSLLKEGDLILEFADPRSFFLEILIPEKQVEKIELGSLVNAKFRAFPSKTYSGYVTKIGPRIIDEIEKVFNVKHVIACEIKLDELPENVKYGMRSWVRIGGRQKARSLKPEKPFNFTDRFISPKILDTKAGK